MASGARAISEAAASLGNTALANAPKQDGATLGDGTPRCRRPYFARLANAARALQWNHPLKVRSKLRGLATTQVRCRQIQCRVAAQRNDRPLLGGGV
eukprot:357433-Chlamydomonas_euryale.AAC.14